MKDYTTVVIDLSSSTLVCLRYTLIMSAGVQAEQSSIMKTVLSDSRQSWQKTAELLKY